MTSINCRAQYSWNIRDRAKMLIVPSPFGNDAKTHLNRSPSGLPLRGQEVLSSFGAYIDSTHMNTLFSANRFLFDIDPDILGRPKKLFDAFVDNESVKGRGIDIVIPGVWILNTKKHISLHNNFMNYIQSGKNITFL
jgi:hypothetical protein